MGNLVSRSEGRKTVDVYKDRELKGRKKEKERITQ
jgi:hypothetical protein